MWTFNHDWDNPIQEIKLLALLNNQNNNLLESITKNYLNKNKWKGCFGAMSIIKYEFLKNIQEKYNIFSLLNYIDTRQKRMHFERIFGFLCCIENNNSLNLSIFENIHHYIKWGLTFEQYINKLNNFKKYKIIKVWSGR